MKCARGSKAQSLSAVSAASASEGAVAEAETAFEWIVDNQAVAPDIAHCVADLLKLRSRGVGRVVPEPLPLSLAALGVGASRIELLPEAVREAYSVADFAEGAVAGSANVLPPSKLWYLTLTGIDIDLLQLEENAVRRPDIAWLHCDLSVGGARDAATRVVVEAGDVPAKDVAEDAPLARAQLGQFDILLDKGTLDYLICEEPEAFLHYLRNVVSLLAGERAAFYVLVSFRDRDLLVALLRVVGLALVRERWLGERREHGICYVARQAAPTAMAERGCQDEFEAQLVRARGLFDEYYTRKAPLLETSQAAGSFDDGSCARGEAQVQSGMPTPVAAPLAEAYAELIPTDLKGEYSFEFFLEDLRATMPEAAARGAMYRSEFAEYLRLNQ